MKWFDGCQSLEEGKKRFKELVMEYHPDRGGSTSTMQEINNAFDVFLRFAKSERTIVEGTGGGWRKHTQLYYDTLGYVLALYGNIEVKTVGDWIWVFGAESPEVVLNLTLMGFEYSRKHKGMFWIDTPARTREYRYNKLSFEEIEEHYGSETKRKRSFVE